MPSAEQVDLGLRLLGALRLDDGRAWGEAAYPWQRADAEAILRGEPRRHLLIRPRGASKTSDVAGVALALLTSQAPAASMSYVYATDEDQAADLLRVLRGYVARSPRLDQVVKLTGSQLTVRRTGATLNVETSDGASAWNKLPWLVLVDELASWPPGGNHRTLWAAIVTSLPKRPDSRLVVMSMAGSPSHFSHRLYVQAQTDPGWRVSHVPGPTPWWTAQDIEQCRRDLLILTESEFARVILAQWVELADELLADSADVLACVTDRGTLDPVPAVSYVAALDIGTRRDFTALAVGHLAPAGTGRTVVIDYVKHWRPAGRRVQIDADVRPVVETIVRRYSAKLIFDRMQAEDLVQRLAVAGIHADEYTFSGTGVTRLAKSLATALRDRRLDLPDDPELVDELRTARLIETAYGAKLTEGPGHHDDLATCVGMICARLLARVDAPASLGSVMARTSVDPEQPTADEAARAARSLSPWREGSPWTVPVG